ncbi:type I methionyl aminopeptidase, partial [Staphylococcus capitis]|nr:type I methionyl aminopeptidase [Staphylococcus capitis]
KGPLLAVGSVLAIEPMLTLGTTQTRVLADDWTVVTTDGSRAAHWEHTVAVTEAGPRILTMRP